MRVKYGQVDGVYKMFGVKEESYDFLAVEGVCGFRAEAVSLGVCGF